MGEEEVVVANILEVALHLVRVITEELRVDVEAGEDGGHEVGGAAHEAEGGVGPDPVHSLAPLDVLDGPGHEELDADGGVVIAGLKEHVLAVLGVEAQVVEAGEGVGGGADGGMAGHVHNPVAAEPYLGAVGAKRL